MAHSFYFFPLMRPTAQILTIGDELLKGSVLNTNAQFLSQQLMALGFSVTAQTSCPDRMESIQAYLERGLENTDVLIATGGLGPTPDDLTRDAAAAFFNSPLIVSQKQLSFIQNYYRSRNKKMPAIVRKEAEFPADATPLFNHYGIALGFSITREGKLAVFLPGVPVELKKMFASLVKPAIQKQFRGIPPVYPVIAKTAGISEPDVMKRLGKDFFEDPFDFGIYPGAGEVALRLYANSPKVQKTLRRKISTRLGAWVYADEDISLSEAVGRLLKKKRQTLAVAESCTGGQLAGEITKIAGSSAYFKGSITAYSNEIKERELRISRSLLKQKGAVAPEVAAELAQNIRKNMKSTYGIGITGIAGPEGGSAAKPVGLVFISISTPKRTSVYREQFLGDRGQVQIKSVKKALEYLWRALKAR